MELSPCIADMDVIGGGMARKTLYDRLYATFEQAMAGGTLQYIPLRDADPQKLQVLMSADEEAFPKYMFLKPDAYAQHGTEGLRQIMCDFQQATRQHYRFLVQEGENGSYIGSLDFMSKPHTRCIELGYFVLPSATGKGIATRMVQDAQSAMPYFQDKLGARSLSLVVDTENAASMAIARKTGFTEKRRYVSDHPMNAGKLDVDWVFTPERQRGR